MIWIDRKSNKNEFFQLVGERPSILRFTNGSRGKSFLPNHVSWSLTRSLITKLSTTLDTVAVTPLNVPVLNLCKGTMKDTIIFSFWSKLELSLVILFLFGAWVDMVRIISVHINISFCFYNIALFIVFHLTYLGTHLCWVLYKGSAGPFLVPIGTK